MGNTKISRVLWHRTSKSLTAVWWVKLCRPANSLQQSSTHSTIAQSITKLTQMGSLSTTFTSFLITQSQSTKQTLTFDLPFPLVRPQPLSSHRLPTLPVCLNWYKSKLKIFSSLQLRPWKYQILYQGLILSSSQLPLLTWMDLSLLDAWKGPSIQLQWLFQRHLTLRKDFWKKMSICIRSKCFMRFKTTILRSNFQDWKTIRDTVSSITAQLKTRLWQHRRHLFGCCTRKLCRHYWWI